MGLCARVLSVVAVVVAVASGGAVAVAAPDAGRHPGNQGQGSRSQEGRFQGYGGSSFGFAWIYARADARRQAVDGGFTDPDTQCVEVFAFGTVFDATVIWECTR